MPIQEVFFTPLTLTSESRPVPLPRNLTNVDLELYWREKANQSDLQADLDVSLLLFNSKGMCYEQITFNHVKSSSGAITHLGDSVGGHEDGDSETISVNLKMLEKRAFAMVLVCTASSHGGFRQCGDVGFRVLQKYSKGRFFAHKEMIRGQLDLSETTGGALDTQAALMCKIFRTPAYDSSSAESIWTISHILCPTPTGKNADDCVPFCQQQLRPQIPRVMIRGEELMINSVKDIVQYIQPHTLAFLRKSFPHNGYRMNIFVTTLLRQLLRETRALCTTSQARHLVKLLHNLFEQIDVNGQGRVHWGDFTSFCVESGMKGGKNNSGASGADEMCAQDLEWGYRSASVGCAVPFRQYGYKYQSANIWSDLNKIVVIEQNSSKIRLLDLRSGTTTLTICVQSKEAYESFAPTPASAASSYSNIR